MWILVIIIIVTISMMKVIIDWIFISFLCVTIFLTTCCSLMLWLILVHRLELIRNPEWRTYAENGQVPAEGDPVFVRYNVDNRWYRGCVDEVRQVTYSLFFDSYFMECYRSL